jgi:zinc transporter, ZIP family
MTLSPILLTAIGVGGSTLLGSLLGYFFKNVSHRTNDTIIGFCAGVMLSASILGLLVPSFEDISSTWLWVPIIGVFVGAALLNLLDLVTPHLHSLTGLDREIHQNNAHLNRVLLFVLAISIHKLPEGIAAGVGFGGDNINNAFNVAFAISLQNIPEAMVIISPLLLAGISKIRTLCIALGIGLLEVIGVFIGYYMGGISIGLLPLMLAFSGGAMLYVVSDEMIPESHTHGYQKSATYALLAGFLLMLLMNRI